MSKCEEREDSASAVRSATRADKNKRSDASAADLWTKFSIFGRPKAAESLVGAPKKQKSQQQSDRGVDMASLLQGQTTITKDNAHQILEALTKVGSGEALSAADQRLLRLVCANHETLSFHQQVVYTCNLDALLSTARRICIAVLGPRVDPTPQPQLN